MREQPSLRKTHADLGPLCFLPLALFLLVVSPASPGAEPARAPGAGRKPESGTEAPRRALTMEEIEIMGQVDKPKAMFVIPKSPHRYYWESGKKDFTQEILAPINKQRVEDLQRWSESADLP